MRFILTIFCSMLLALGLSAQEQRIGDTTVAGIVSYTLRAINGKGTGQRPAYFDSVGKLVPGAIITNGWALNGNTGTNYSNTFIGTIDNQPLVFKSNNTEGIRIVPSGQVGIGTPSTTTSFTDATYKLFVYGSIRAKKIRVDINTNTWADYVFDQTYKLPTLKEVETFIKKYKHLPEVPSAQEVDKEGIDLGSNQAVLLRKIEELTLYAIEQQKEIEQLKLQNNEQEEQKRRNRQLEERIKKLEEKLKS